MKLSLLTICLVLLLTTCKKETISTISQDLIGVWLSEDENTQYTIKNYKRGSEVFFRDINVNGVRILEVNFAGKGETFTILNLKSKSFDLIDGNKLITHFIKVKEL